MEVLARLDTLHFLIERASAPTGALPHFRVQKTIYLLQRMGHSLGYRFTLYRHGPYSFELANDLEAMASLGALQRRRDERTRELLLEPQPRAARRWAPEEDLQQWEQYLQAVPNGVREWPRARLELATTADFVRQALISHRGKADDDEVKQRLTSLKPGHSCDAYTRALTDADELVTR